MKKIIYLILILFLFSCNTKNKVELTKILPTILDGQNKISEKHLIKNLDSISEFNINHKLKDWVFAKYDKNLIVKRFRYDSPIIAYSEYSISYELSQKSGDNYFKYISGDKIVILNEKDIYLIENSKNKNIESFLSIKPKSSVKIPKGKHSYILGTQKLILNDSDTFPFYTQYIQKDHLFNDLRVTSIRGFNTTNSKVLIDFIKKQTIISETDNTIFFSLKEDPDNKFLWIKSKNMLLLNFSDTEQEKLLEF